MTANATMRRKIQETTKLETGIPGFDTIAEGGLPRGGLTLLSGAAGSAKTVFAVQYLAAGITQYDEAGVFVTFEERPDRMCSYMRSLGWDLARWEAEGKWAFVDASPFTEGVLIHSGAFNLDALVARISHAVQAVGAKRLVMDSLGTMFSQVRDPQTMRTELFRLGVALTEMGVTSILTSEREVESDGFVRYGLEEFVADNVIILRNALEEEKRRRTVEILKFRGAKHQKGEFPFTVLDGEGIVIIPLSGMKLSQKTSTIRATSGSTELDAMCGGGFLRDSMILVSGATGTGKTLSVTQFLAAGGATGERSLLFAYEESRDQIFRNAASWGFDFEDLEARGLLKVICDYPEATSIDEHLVIIKRAIDAFKPARVAVDSLSALERITTVKSYRELVLGLTALIKERQILGICTTTTAALLGGTSITEAHVSTITDTIILLRYVEILGEMRRGLMILKMRGSAHNKEIREFRIDGKRGMHIGRAFQNVSGILTGSPNVIVNTNELAHIRSMFDGFDDGATR